jgi:hypothetical protein
MQRTGSAQGAWQIADVDRYVEGTIGTVVLVDIGGAAPEYYIVPGDDLRALVRTRHEEFMARVGGRRPQNRTANTRRSRRRSGKAEEESYRRS